MVPGEVIRATEEEKEFQIRRLEELHGFNEKAAAELQKIQKAAVQNENIFVVLMEAAKYCSLGQMTQTMFEVGGQYRRNM